MEVWPHRDMPQARCTPLWARGQQCHPQPRTPLGALFQWRCDTLSSAVSLSPKSPGTPGMEITQTILPPSCQWNVRKSQRCLQLLGYWRRVRVLASSTGGELGSAERSWGGSWIFSELQEGGSFLDALMLHWGDTPCCQLMLLPLPISKITISWWPTRARRVKASLVSIPHPGWGSRRSGSIATRI